MTAGAGRVDVGVDTSVAVPYLVPDHAAHRVVAAALDGMRAALAGHALFETYTVLTRLPPEIRLSTRDAAAVISDAFGEPLPHPPAQGPFLTSIAARGIFGGAVYDALVGAAAKHAGVPLLTRDRRALGTYAALDVEARLLAG